MTVLHPKLCYNKVYYKGTALSTVNVLKFRPLFLSVLKEILAFRAGINKMLVRIANRKYPDQTTYSEVV